MLTDGVVNIPPKEEKAIDLMVKELERFYMELSTATKLSSDNAICAKLKEYTNKVLAPKYKFDFLFWRFIYEPSRIEKAGYIPSYHEIMINLAHDVEDSSKPLGQQAIKWGLVAESIFHEWVHVKQDISIKKKHSQGMMSPALLKMYKKIAYHDMTWEQMAIARAEIEWIKRNLYLVDPKRIAKWLQWYGLKSPDTGRLKQENPKAYKRILKYAVMFVLKKMAQRAIKNRSVSQLKT